MATDCIFCKIIDKKIPAEIVHEDEYSAAFKDIYPKTPVHLLIVPKKHIPSIADMDEGDEKTVGHMIKIAKSLAQSNSLPGYRLQFNVGKDGGQVIFHLHLHLMGGTPFTP